MAAAARRPGLLSPSALVRRNAVYKGFLGGSRGWMIVGGTFWAARFMRKSLGKNEVFAASEILKPGDSILIRTIVPPSRKAAKAAKKSA